MLGIQFRHTSIMETAVVSSSCFIPYSSFYYYLINSTYFKCECIKYDKWTNNYQLTIWVYKKISLKTNGFMNN